MSNLLLFGITGQIGGEIANLFAKENIKVIGVSRTKYTHPKTKNIEIVEWDVFNNNPDILKKFGPFHRICWSQGKNTNDSIFDFQEEINLDLYKANCLYILSSLNKLIEYNLLAPKARLCVISSIWQNIARQNKLSYCVTKSAIHGLINSLSIDLAKDGYLINAILPGALDTKMTINNLNKEQLDSLKKATLFDRLSEIKDIAHMVNFLCNQNNTSITGQFINIDLGFSNAKII
jgi:NAD(P)-dependent dehydrogenase (short-subunit alcohol dehydrogenase family)